ncbi:MAG: hypothetical protein V4720_06180 [Pseudomonadota bacterium]
MRLKLSVDPSGLLARIEALAAHCATAPIGDPICRLAVEVGEINADTDVRVTRTVEGETVVVTFDPVGNLARMLEAFEARAA